MPDLKKLLSKFNNKERGGIEAFIGKLISLNWHTLDIKKLKGHQSIFRARKGKIRIIFIKEKNQIFILSIDRRSEKTYKNF